MPRRTLGALVSVVGVAFLVVAFGNGLFGASSAWEDLSNDVRPSYTTEAIEGLRADADRLRALTNELGSDVLPTLAQALGVTESDLASRFLSSFPATARGALAMPQIADALDARAALLQAQQANFRAADGIPPTVPWFITITGVLAVAGGLMMTRPGRAAPALTGILGIVMITVPLALTLPSKAADADALNRATATVFAQSSITDSETSIETLRAMAAELQTGLIPGLAEQLGVTPAQATAFVQQNFPVITAALAATPQTLARLEAANELIAANADEYATVREVPNRTVAWTVVAGGIAVLLLASIALATNTAAIARAQVRRQRREQRAA